MKKLFLYLVCSIALYATSLQEAWELMEHKSDALKAQQQDVAMAKSKQKSATSMYLPSVSLTGSYTHLSEPLKLEDEEFVTLVKYYLSNELLKLALKNKKKLQFET